MSRTGIVIATFGGDDQIFRLPWRELIELQESRDAGPAFILARLMAGQWAVQDIREVIRLGLQGGGMEAAKALKLVRLHIEGKPEQIGGPDGWLMLSIRVLSAAIDGAPDEPLGETQAPNQPNGLTTSPTEKSGSEPSTQSAH